MADSGVIYLYPDFMCLRRFNFDVLDGQIFPRLPRYCGLFTVSVYSSDVTMGHMSHTLQVIVYRYISLRA